MTEIPDFPQIHHRAASARRFSFSEKKIHLCPPYQTTQSEDLSLEPVTIARGYDREEVTFVECHCDRRPEPTSPFSSHDNLVKQVLFSSFFSDEDTDPERLRYLPKITSKWQRWLQKRCSWIQRPCSVYNTMLSGHRVNTWVLPGIKQWKWVESI